jgi:hypothetical protein
VRTKIIGSFPLWGPHCLKTVCSRKFSRITARQWKGRPPGRPFFLVTSTDLGARRGHKDRSLAVIWKAEPDNDYGHILKLLMLAAQRRGRSPDLSEIDKAELVNNGWWTSHLSSQTPSEPLCSGPVSGLRTVNTLKICSDLRSYKHLGCVNEPKTTQISANRTIFN